MYNLLQQLGVHGFISVTLSIALCYAIGCLLIWLFVRYILDIYSNSFFKWEFGILCFLFGAYSGYAAYQYGIFTCIITSVFAVIPILSVAVAWACTYVDKYRCANCHIFVKPTVIEKKEGLFHLGEYKKTGKVVKLHSKTHSYIENGEEVAETVSEYNYETVANIYQDMEYRNRCPECSYEWNSKGKEGRGTTRGPICYMKSTSRSIAWDEKQTEFEVTKDEYGNEIDRREVSSRIVSRSRDGGGNDWSTHDAENYRPYFHRYINGDKDAIDEYYDEYWGNVYL